MNKVYPIIISIIFVLCSCNNNQKEEKNISVEDVFGAWEGEKYYDGESGDTISSILKIGKYKEAVYSTNYTMSGKYKIVKDTIYFEYTIADDLTDEVQKMWFKFQNDSTLISMSGDIFNKISNNMYEYEAKIEKEEQEEQERLNREYQELKQKADTLKPTMYEVVNILTNHIFIGKKNNYYFTYNFTYTVLDEEDNAMFWCKYEEFELNSNYGTTPMEILKQSANSATFLKSEKLMVTVMRKDLNMDWIVVKRNRAYDDMPRFDFRISGIERDFEGNLVNGRIDAQALGIALTIKPK